MKKLIIIFLSLSLSLVHGQDKRPHVKPDAQVKKPAVEKPEKGLFGLFVVEFREFMVVNGYSMENVAHRIWVSISLPLWGLGL